MSFISFRNTAMRVRKTNFVNFNLIIKMSSLRQQLVLVLSPSSNRNTIFNHTLYFLRAVLQSNTVILYIYI